MTSRRSFSLCGPEGTRALGRGIGERCRGGERIALVGDLGAGKTTFTRGLAEGLGVAWEAVSSPTFTILHEHADGRDGLRLVHADLYRVGEAEELEALGWEELLSMSGVVLVVEWADRLPTCIPEPDLRVRLGHGVSPDERHAEILIHDDGHRLLGTDAPCPICGKPTGIEESSLPFCSARCRMADLGNWFSGSYSVSREIEEDDLVDPDLA